MVKVEELQVKDGTSSPSKSVYTKATSDPLSIEEQKEQDYYDEEGDDVA